MPNFKLTIDVNIYAQEVVMLEADDKAQARAALEAYLEGDGPLHENLETVDWEVVGFGVESVDDPAYVRAADWLS